MVTRYEKYDKDGDIKSADCFHFVQVGEQEEGGGWPVVKQSLNRRGGEKGYDGVIAPPIDQIGDSK